MSELRGVTHLGWRCTARSCETVIRWAPTHDVDADRKASRTAAEAKGWVFTPEMPYRWDGKQYLGKRPERHYCPKHAPVAAAQTALRLARMTQQ